MKFYSHFAKRQRNPIGVKIKMRQARIISQMALNAFSGNCNILELGPGDGYIANIAIAITTIPAILLVETKLNNKNPKGITSIKCIIPP